MLTRIHDTLGLSSKPPAWVGHLRVIGPLILITIVITAVRIQSPEHVAYHRATLTENLSGTGGIALGDLLKVTTATRDDILIRATSPFAAHLKIGSTLCLNQLTDSVRGGTHYTIARPSRCDL